jgi:hypothetical protein
MEIRLCLRQEKETPCQIHSTPKPNALSQCSETLKHFSSPSPSPALFSTGWFIFEEKLIGEKTISTKKKDYLQRI